MDVIYNVYTARDELILSTRDFELAMYIFATADKKSGWPRFSWQATSSPRPAPVIQGYPDAFLSR